VKRLLIALVVQLRLLSLWRFWHRKRITILMLHGVTDEQSDDSWKPLWERPTVEQLAASIKQLCEYYTPISLHEAVRVLDGSAAAVDHGLVVTFDDGYRNNFSEALPLLKSMGVPATFFVATGFVETGLPYWVDRLDYALQHAPDDRRLLKSEGYEFDLRGLDREALAASYRNLRVSIKNKEQSDEDMLRIVNEFSEFLETASESAISDVINTDSYVAVATWAEQNTAIEQGATIGSHSVDHHRLTAIPRSDVDRQLVESKSEIEEKLGIDCEFFCYPNGSVDEFVRERVRHTEYRAAVTTVHGLNKAGDDLYTLKRYPMPRSLDPQEKLLRLSGVFESRVFQALLGNR